MAKFTELVYVYTAPRGTFAVRYHILLLVEVSGLLGHKPATTMHWRHASTEKNHEKNVAGTVGLGAISMWKGILQTVFLKLNESIRKTKCLEHRIASVEAQLFRGCKPAYFTHVSMQVDESVVILVEKGCKLVSRPADSYSTAHHPSRVTHERREHEIYTCILRPQLYMTYSTEIEFTL